MPFTGMVNEIYLELTHILTRDLTRHIYFWSTFDAEPIAYKAQILI